MQYLVRLNLPDAPTVFPEPGDYANKTAYQAAIQAQLTAHFEPLVADAVTQLTGLGWLIVYQGCENCAVVVDGDPALVAPTEALPVCQSVGTEIPASYLS